MSDAGDNHEEIADPTAVIGHAGFFKSLARSMQSGRMHHAWLLTGPSGIGKASVARLAAAWLLSEEVKTRNLFGGELAGFSISLDDPGAKLVFNGAHPDYLAIVPVLDDNRSGQIKIDQIRAMVPFMARKPARGKFRVTVIDSMDEVNRNGANAMLKLLEEPPENSVILIVSSRPGQLPPTIRSRCRVVRLSPLEALSCRDVLVKKLPDADTKQVDLLAQLCAGAPGRAISLAESGAADCYQVACSLIAESKTNISALVDLAGKWGRGAAAGRITREGAVFCLDRLLRLAALTASGRYTPVPCTFEVPAIRVLCGRHSSTQLAVFHGEFLRQSANAEGLYLDFSQFLLRQMMKLCQKTLP
jgi:DNA polymerase-3 subunit delta'